MAMVSRAGRIRRNTLPLSHGVPTILNDPSTTYMTHALSSTTSRSLLRLSSPGRNALEDGQFIIHLVYLGDDILCAAADRTSTQAGFGQSGRSCENRLTAPQRLTQCQNMSAGRCMTT